MFPTPPFEAGSGSPSSKAQGFLTSHWRILRVPATVDGQMKREPVEHPTAGQTEDSVARRWGFSLILLAVYLASFHSWLEMPEAMVTVTGWIVPMVLSFLGYEAWRRGYFVNPIDAGCHAGVILDLWLEGVFVRLHEGLGFYACAASFTVVIAGYRIWSMRRRRPELMPAT